MELDEHKWNRPVYSANPVGLGYLVVATPKRASIKKNLMSTLKKKHKNGIILTLLIPSTITGQFYYLHSPSGLLKHGFAFSKRTSDFTKSMKTFGRIYTGNACVLWTQVGRLTWSVYMVQRDTVHGEGILKPAVHSQPTVKYYVGTGSVDSESSTAV